MLDLLKFQMVLIYTTKGSSVCGHVIVAYVQKKYSCSSQTCRPTCKIGLSWKSKVLYRRRVLVSIVMAWFSSMTMSDCTWPSIPRTCCKYAFGNRL